MVAAPTAGLVNLVNKGKPHKQGEFDFCWTGSSLSEQNIEDEGYLVYSGRCN